MKKLLMAMLALLMMAGCSSRTDHSRRQPRNLSPSLPEFVTGRVAFQKLYIAARGWARDAQPYGSNR